ncbi:class I SAM-dependent methyltransferase [Streptomyces sp. NPDC051662]|uniref:SAM-dependent methyltransferase n=1 Tax=Streptomyces sp. NPDC051662 TaxID=3154750 RepID=UPI003440DCF0
MSTAAEVEISYGVSPDFYRLWLGEELHYTCAVFDDTDDPRQAQLANLAYLAVERQVKDVHGITLSRAQHTEVEHPNLPGVTVSCADYRDYEPGERFDALTSICMIEHVCRPEQIRVRCVRRSTARSRSPTGRLSSWSSRTGSAVREPAIPVAAELRVKRLDRGVREPQPWCRCCCSLSVRAVRLWRWTPELGDRDGRGSSYRGRSTLPRQGRFPYNRISVRPGNAFRRWSWPAPRGSSRTTRISKKSELVSRYKFRLLWGGE